MINKVKNRNKDYKKLQNKNTYHKVRTLQIDFFKKNLSMDRKNQEIRVQHLRLKKQLNKNLCSGKKIDFILQELFREANTLSVKLDDPNLKSNALDMKLFIEEIREQIQNVE